MSSSLVTKEMQFETLMRYHVLVNKIGKDKNKKAIMSLVGMDAQKQACSCVTHGYIYLHISFEFSFFFHLNFLKGTLQ